MALEFVVEYVNHLVIVTEVCLEIGWPIGLAADCVSEMIREQGVLFM